MGKITSETNFELETNENSDSKNKPTVKELLLAGSQCIRDKSVRKLHKHITTLNITM